MYVYEELMVKPVSVNLLVPAGNTLYKEEGLLSIALYNSKLETSGSL